MFKHSHQNTLVEKAQKAICSRMSGNIRREVVGWERRRPHPSDGADAVSTTPPCEARAQATSGGRSVVRGRARIC
jgi:hypothetical protein